MYSEICYFVSDENQYFLPNGEINWNCPCHGNMIYGPCALEYREFLTSCVFPKDEASDAMCRAKHMSLEKCVALYPTVFPELQPERLTKDSSPTTDSSGQQKTT